jgi:hypothetical protein
MSSFNFIVGDSIAAGTAIAAGLKRSGAYGVKSVDDKGISKVGAPPQEVLGFLKEIGDSKLKDKIVILSSGISNGPDALEKVKEQLKYLKGLNCKVYIIGVSNDPTNAAGKTKFPKLVGMNEKLTEVAKEFNFVFLGGFKPSSDNIHPSSYQTYYKNTVVKKIAEPWPTSPTQTLSVSGDTQTNGLTPSGMSPSAAGLTPSGMTPSPPPEPPIKGVFVLNIEKPGILSCTALGDLTITQKELGVEDFFYFGEESDYTNEEIDDEYSEGAYTGAEEDLAFEVAEGQRLSQGQELLTNFDMSNPANLTNTDTKNGDPNVVESAPKVSTTATGKIKKMIEIGLGQVGYQETTGYPQHNGKDSKYGAYFGMNGYHWCGMFVGWCCNQAGMILSTKDFNAKNGNICNAISCECGVSVAKKKGVWVSNGDSKSARQNSSIKPDPGDIVFFSWNFNKSVDHVGIVVEDAGGGFVNTVEGNTAGGSKGGANQKGAGVWTKKRQKAVIIGYCKTSLYDPKNLDEFLAVASKKSAKASEA